MPALGKKMAPQTGAGSLTRFTWANGKLKVDRKRTGYKSAAQKQRVLIQGREIKSFRAARQTDFP